MPSTIEIRPVEAASLGLFDEHFARHCAESGRRDHHFMPYEPNCDHGDGPTGLNSRALYLDVPRWERWWITVFEGEVISHVNRKGSTIRTALHRADLGIGIERPFRADGLGHRLVATAIEFCHDAGELEWLDLSVFAHTAFAHKANVRAMYESLGFQLVGEVADQIRIGNQSIEDIAMTLSVAGACRRCKKRNKCV